MEAKISPRLEATARAAAARFDFEDMIVDTKTIGTNLCYSLRTINISKTGMLLSWNSSVKVPFIENTIIELKVDTTRQHLSFPVDCLGKVVRRIDHGADPATDFGVHIVQMEAEDRLRWDKTFEKFGKAKNHPSQPLNANRA